MSRGTLMSIVLTLAVVTFGQVKGQVDFGKVIFSVNSQGHSVHAKLALETKENVVQELEKKLVKDPKVIMCN